MYVIQDLYRPKNKRYIDMKRDMDRYGINEL